MVKAVVVEIDGSQNESLFFRPVGRVVRGRFDPRRLPDESGTLARRFPKGVPGQRLELDVTAGRGAIVEPLHLAEFKTEAAEISKLGSLPASRQEFELSEKDAMTWAWFIKTAVDIGLAHVVIGELPKVTAEDADLTFLTKPEANPLDKLTAALERQNELLGKLLAQRA